MSGQPTCAATVQQRMAAVEGLAPVWYKGRIVERVVTTNSIEPLARQIEIGLNDNLQSQASSQRRSWYDAYASVTKVAGSNFAQM